jgi:hypothetical protein
MKTNEDGALKRLWPTLDGVEKTGQNPAKCPGKYAAPLHGCDVSDLIDNFLG